MSLEWALIPVAGRGTRMFPAAAVVPKALLPVGVKPMLHWALEEALDAGIDRLVLVWGPGQDLIREYVEAALDAGRSGSGGELARLGVRLAHAELHWVLQPQPAGVGDAFIRCRDLTGEDDFGVLLPDNWFLAETPPIGQIADTRERTGLCTLGLSLVEPEEADLFGNVGGVDLEALGSDSFRIRRLQDKLPGTFAERAREPTLRGCARYALGPEFYEALAATGPPANGEWDDVPAFQYLIREHGLAAHRIEGVHYDVGLPAGYLAAASRLAERDRRGRGQA